MKVVATFRLVFLYSVIDIEARFIEIKSLQCDIFQTEYFCSILDYILSVSNLNWSTHKHTHTHATGANPGRLLLLCMA